MHIVCHSALVLRFIHNFTHNFTIGLEVEDILNDPTRDFSCFSLLYIASDYFTTCAAVFQKKKVLNLFLLSQRSVGLNSYSTVAGILMPHCQNYKVIRE